MLPDFSKVTRRMFYWPRPFLALWAALHLAVSPQAFALKVEETQESDGRRELTQMLLPTDPSVPSHAGLESGPQKPSGPISLWNRWRASRLWSRFGDRFEAELWYKELKPPARAELSEKARQLVNRLIERKMPQKELKNFLLGGLSKAVRLLTARQLGMRLEQLETWLASEGPLDPQALRRLLEGVLTYGAFHSPDQLEIGIEFVRRLSRIAGIRWHQMDAEKIHPLFARALELEGRYWVEFIPAVEELTRKPPTGASLQSEWVVKREQEISLVPEPEGGDTAGLEEALRQLPRSGTLHVMDPALLERNSYRGLAVLAGLEDAVLIGSPDVAETVLELIRRDIREVFVYGLAPWVSRFKSAAEVALIRVRPYLPGQVPFPVFLRRLLANLSGLPPKAVSERVDLNRLAAWLNQLA